MRESSFQFKIRINDLVIHSILLYPILLSSLVLIGKSPFFITAPYFFVVLIILLLKTKKSIKLRKVNLSILIIFLISIYNFTEIRYSLPLFFMFYIFIFYTNIKSFDKEESERIINLFYRYFIIYLVLGFVFILNKHSYMSLNNRYLGFVGSGTLFPSLIIIFYIVFHIKNDDFLKRMSLFIPSFYLIYITETRLALLFLIFFPFLYWFMNYKLISKKIIFWIYYSALFFLYPVYQLLINYFPYIVTFRYEDKRDASFGLRYILYNYIYESFTNSSLINKLLGNGNEFARKLIIEKTNLDLFPHNDFIRLILDLGIISLLLYTFLLYKLSIKNRYVLFSVLTYILMFYSNMIYNLFFISLILILSKLKTNTFR